MVHRKGTRHANADALSRLAPQGPCACTTGGARCKEARPEGTVIAPVRTAEGTQGEVQLTDHDLGLTLDDWRRLQLEEAPLRTLRAAAEAGGEEYIIWEDLLM